MQENDEMMLITAICLHAAAGDEINRQDTDIAPLHRQRGEREVPRSVSVLQRAALR